MILFKTALILLISIGRSASEDGPVVTIPQGTLRGTYLTSTLGRKFSAYMSLPFAQPPVGPLRFRSPVEPSGWDGERDASKDAPFCIQNNPYVRDDRVSGTEDCLYLNVFTPKGSSQAGPLLPVMVFFHGGGWVCGSGNKLFYGPERLLDRDVVYVGVNYRLGTLAFFSTMDAAAPGNYAFKDQNFALRWIQKNIKYFGGDPNLVTIFGESAGGASTTYHMVSPKSKGLFHRIIAQSGVSLCVWANAVPGIAEKQSKTLGEAMQCPTEDNYEMVECLRTKPAADLITAQHIFHKWEYNPMIPFKPVVEPEDEDAFLTEDPRVILAQGRFHQVPLMLGMNEKEGAIQSASIFGIPELRKDLSDNFDRVAPITFDYYHSKDVDFVTKAIKDFYLNGQSIITNDTTDPLTDIYTDTYFLNGINEQMKLQLPNSDYPVYFYHLTYRGKHSFSEIFGDLWRDYGVCHVDELLYIFYLGLFPETLNEKDASMSDLFLTMWNNFAISGNPNIPDKPKTIHLPEWKPMTSTAEWEYLTISQKPTMSSRFLEDRRNFWDTLPLWPKYHSAAYSARYKRSDL